MSKEKMIPIGQKVRITSDTVHHGLRIGGIYKIGDHASWGAYFIYDEDGDLRCVSKNNLEAIPSKSIWEYIKGFLTKFKYTAI